MSRYSTKKNIKKIVFVILALLVLAAVGASLPPIRDRISTHLNDLEAQINYKLHPPEKFSFVPQDQVARVVQMTIQALTPSPSVRVSADPTQTLAVIQETSTPTVQPTPLPASANLQGIRYMRQDFGTNECAPTNLAMELSYWGWPGAPQDPAPDLKPYPDDKNVMPYEMADYVQNKTDFDAVVRWGGTPQLLKKLVVNGYPVLIETGVVLRDMTGVMDWMGHYTVVSGYDDASHLFTVQDSYLPNGKDYRMPYDKLVGDWRSFDYVFLIVYPKDKQNDLFAVLGSYADEASSDQIAIQIASQEISTLSGDNLFYAWFNRGTSLVHQQDYQDASAAYDQAYTIYATLPQDENLPFRMTWYQTGPYYAYYYTGRYQDVERLATQTLKTTNQPYLEESYYWRARAEIALGDNSDAITDLNTSLKYHAGFAPSLDILKQLGIKN
ncbi:MAG TPA: C39 family peptidase [Anaerolineaceae bacterium]|nr:C39 family peptidase [Anaerolineaceae bacterium]